MCIYRSHFLVNESQGGFKLKPVYLYEKNFICSSWIKLHAGVEDLVIIGCLTDHQLYCKFKTSLD